MNYAVILAGGVGSRFWPFSRELEPKQFLKITGQNSLLQSTVQRLKGLVDRKRIFIVTNNIYFYEVKSQLIQFGIPDENIILEPKGKNTCPAIALCAKLIQRNDEKAVLLVMPSDHYIKKPANFRKTVNKAVLCAEEGFLATIGIKPLFASTGYGYVKAGLRQNGFFKAEKFFEKPDKKRAKKYFKDKSYFWNSGIFVWKASVFLEEVKKYLPKLYSAMEMIRSTGDIVRVWPKIEPISVDYGILERSKKIALVPSSFYWTDLGSWDALSEIFPKDKSGNFTNTDTLNLDSRGICVFSKANRLVSTIGLNDLVIADTADALLVCKRERTQEVKQVVEQLKNLRRKEHHVHLTEKRPWGSFTVLQEGAGFKIKIIEIEPGRRLSLQRHRQRAEHWVVVCGTARVTQGKKTHCVKSNQSIYIPKGKIHRLENSSRHPLRIVEVQTGSYVGEDDIERFEDDFKKECRT